MVPHDKCREIIKLSSCLYSYGGIQRRYSMRQFSIITASLWRTPDTRPRYLQSHIKSKQVIKSQATALEVTQLLTIRFNIHPAWTENALVHISSECIPAALNLLLKCKSLKIHAFYYNDHRRKRKPNKQTERKLRKDFEWKIQFVYRAM